MFRRRYQTSFHHDDLQSDLVTPEMEDASSSSCYVPRSRIRQPNSSSATSVPMTSNANYGSSVGLGGQPLYHSHLSPNSTASAAASLKYHRAAVIGGTNTSAGSLKNNMTAVNGYGGYSSAHQQQQQQPLPQQNSNIVHYSSQKTPAYGQTGPIPGVKYRVKNSPNVTSSTSGSQLPSLIAPTSKEVTSEMYPPPQPQNTRLTSNRSQSPRLR